MAVEGLSGKPCFKYYLLDSYLAVRVLLHEPEQRCRYLLSGPHSALIVRYIHNDLLPG